MKLKSLKSYWHLLTTFRNGPTLIRVLRSGGLLAHGTPLSEAVLWDGTTLCHPKDRGGLVGILLEIFQNNLYRIGEFYVPKQGDVVVDAGAHVGLFSFYLLRNHPCRVLAFEPCGENYTCLAQNLSGFDKDRYAIHRLAVGGEHGKVRVETPASTNRSHDAVAVKVTGDDPDSVDVVTLTDVLSLAGTDQVALLKMDIEGAEYDVFKAADTETLRKFSRIAMEYHDNLREGTRAILEEKLGQSHHLEIIPDGPGNSHGLLFATLK